MANTQTQPELNLYQKLADIRKSVEVLKKDKEGFNYTYVQEETILAKITNGMKKYGISLIPNIVPGTTKVLPYSYSKPKVTKQGELYEDRTNEVIVDADMTWTWINDSNPSESLTITWILVGQQADAAQAFGAGLTYSKRYFLLKFFNCATTDDDPDQFRSKQREAEAEEERLIASQIIEKIDKLVKQIIEEGPKERVEAAKAIASKYAKNGDYFAIKESTLAGKLLEELTTFTTSKTKTATAKEK